MTGPTTGAVSTPPAWKRLAVAGWRAQGGFVWVAGGKAAAVGANALLLVVLARILEVETYGLFATAVGAQIFLSRVLLLGLDAGTIRLAGLPSHERLPAQVMAAAFRLLGASSAGLVVCAIVAGTLLHSFNSQWPAWAASAVAVGAAGVALVDFASACRLARLRYLAAAGVQSGAALVRMASVVTMAVLFPASQAVIVAYAASTFLFGLVQLGFLPVRTGFERGLPSKVFRFSARIGISDVLVALSLHLGSFLLFVMSDRTQLGLFGLALSLSLGGRVLSQSFFQTILPKAARLDSAADLPRFLRRALVAALVLIAAGVPVVIAGGVLLPLIARPEYAAAVPSLYWLAASVFVSVVQVPFVATSLYLLRPGYLVTTNLLRVGAIGALTAAMIIPYGATGAAVAQFAGSLISAVALAALALRSTRQALQMGMRPERSSHAVITGEAA